MKIKNITEFSELLIFCFSEEFKVLEPSEQKNIKTQIKKSVDQIDGAVHELEIVISSELERICYNRFCGNTEKVFFIIECLPAEKIKNIIVKYVNGNFFKEKGNYADYELVTQMLEYLPEAFKIKVFEEANIKKTLEIMSKFNKIANNWRVSKKKRKYYKDYYNICKKALASE